MSDSSVPAGQESLYAVVDLICKLGNAGIQIKANSGKVSLSEGFSLVMGLIPLFAPALSDLGDVPGEIKSLSQADRDALIAHIASDLSIIDEHAQALLAAGLQSAQAIFALVEAIKAPAAAAAAALPSSSASTSGAPAQGAPVGGGLTQAPAGSNAATGPQPGTSGIKVSPTPSGS